jgi:hypothetical protein
MRVSILFEFNLDYVYKAGLTSNIKAAQDKNEN